MRIYAIRWQLVRMSSASPIGRGEAEADKKGDRDVAEKELCVFRRRLEGIFVA